MGRATGHRTKITVAVRAAGGGGGSFTAVAEAAGYRMGPGMDPLTDPQRDIWGAPNRDWVTGEVVPEYSDPEPGSVGAYVGWRDEDWPADVAKPVREPDVRVSWTPLERSTQPAPLAPVSTWTPDTAARESDAAEPLSLDEAVVVPMYRLQRDPDMSEHFGKRLLELDDLTEEEFEALREYARRAEAEVRLHDRDAELLAAGGAVAVAIRALRDPLAGRCRHCWSDLSKTPGLPPGARYDSENCKRAAQKAAVRRARMGGGSFWLSDEGRPKADETLYVLDQVASFAALGVVAGDLIGAGAGRLLAPLQRVLAD